jgi:hypothetical protein
MHMPTYSRRCWIGSALATCGGLAVSIKKRHEETTLSLFDLKA